jgi:hypothetical protein
VGVLKNSKYERMAQLMAQGKTPSLAYAAVHPKAKRPEANIGRFMKSHPEIAQRAAEIAQTAITDEKIVLTAAQQVATVDKAYVLRNLKEIVERCMQSAPVLDRDGDQVYVETPTGQVAPAYGFDAKPAVAALKLLGLEIGMFVQRHAQVNDPFANLPAEQVQLIMQALAGMKGRLIEHGAPSASLAPPVAHATPA